MEENKSYSNWIETFIVTFICGLIIIVWSYSSFSKPFFAENFQYVGQYRAANGDWSKFLFSPTQDGWFKPLEKLVHILLFLVLPLRAEAYHIANFVLVMCIVIVLHRYLLLYVSSMSSRLLALMYFSSLSLQLTLIGYINLFGTILVSLLYLVAIYNFSLYFVEQRISLLVIGSMAGFFALFAKETAVSFFPVVCLIMLFGYYKYGKEAKDRRWLWMPPLIILIGIMLLILGRVVSIGSLFSTAAVYSPKLSLSQLERNLVAFISGISNTSFNAFGITGFGGVGSLLFAHFKTPFLKWIDVLVAIISAIWLVWLLFKARVFPFPALVAILLAATSFSVHLLTQNLQSYYRTDFLIAFTIILALALDKLTKYAYIISCLLIFAMACNGYISNKYSYYDWQYTSIRADEAFHAVEKLYKPEHKEIWFITSDVSFWKYALGRDIPYSSMLPELLGNSRLAVKYYEYKTISKQECSEKLDVLCIDIDNGYLRYPAADTYVPALGSFVAFPVPGN